MTTTVNLDNDAISKAGLANAEAPQAPIEGEKAIGHVDVDKISQSGTSDEDWYEGKPTQEELKSLRRVSGKIMWSMWTIAFVELCERFSYYGSAVLYTNFVNRPLPPGSNTGAPMTPDGLPGALGQGLKTSQAISLFNQFFAYIMPLLG